MNWITQLWVPVDGELVSTVVGTSFCVCVNWIAQVVAGKKQEEKEKKEKEKKRQTKRRKDRQKVKMSVSTSYVLSCVQFCCCHWDVSAFPHLPLGRFKLCPFLECFV